MGVQIKACLLIAATKPFLIISRPASSKTCFRNETLLFSTLLDFGISILLFLQLQRTSLLDLVPLEGNSWGRRKLLKTSCGYGVATGGPLAWGLCYDKEMSPSKLYCDDYYEYAYPCTPGVSSWQRNYNYGKTGEALKIDLLNHPEFIENNATLAFQAAIWKWMTPGKKHQPSAHDAFVGIWKPTKNDTLAKRVPGFGTTMNVLYGDEACGKGDDESMNNIVSHYL
ncbi:hypothetical protein OIU84_021116 [Salix udensis]|uniref:Glycoside hydrolase family 19 catalytic domain-containing protein n=1 Tax=Salix udensis TaxID=889485 RepID=A0AAD6KUB1_9ROSI|nr:hypothetical protein OIU84_021116 [Salix udensis]